MERVELSEDDQARSAEYSGGDLISLAEMFSPLPTPNPKVVDRAARDVAVLLLRRFANGHLSNEDFEDRMPITHDPAIGAIWSTAWLYYSGMREHRLTSLHQLHPDAKRAWTRWMLFLDSDFRYEWPPILEPGNNPVAAEGDYLLRFIKRLLVRKQLPSKEDQFHAAGHYPVWPFISKIDYKKALASPRRLARKTVE